MPLEGPRLRQKCAFVYLAGPGAEILLAGAIALLAGDALFEKSNDYSMIALQSLVIAATAGAVINLIPQSAPSSQGTIPNDGLGILLSLFGRRPTAWPFDRSDPSPRL
jgi:hypothetical protein